MLHADSAWKCSVFFSGKILRNSGQQRWMQFGNSGNCLFIADAKLATHQPKRGEPNMTLAEDFDVGHDLEITKTTRRAVGGGTWVSGTLSGHRFEALLFPEHAAN